MPTMLRALQPPPPWPRPTRTFVSAMDAASRVMRPARVCAALAAMVAVGCARVAPMPVPVPIMVLAASMGFISRVRFLNLSISRAASTYSFFTRIGCTWGTTGVKGKIQ